MIGIWNKGKGTEGRHKNLWVVTLETRGQSQETTGQSQDSRKLNPN